MIPHDRTSTAAAKATTISGPITLPAAGNVALRGHPVVARSRRRLLWLRLCRRWRPLLAPGIRGLLRILRHSRIPRVLLSPPRWLLHPPLRRLLLWITRLPVWRLSVWRLSIWRLAVRGLPVRRLSVWLLRVAAARIAALRTLPPQLLLLRLGQATPIPLRSTPPRRWIAPPPLPIVLVVIIITGNDVDPLSDQALDFIRTHVPV